MWGKHRKRSFLHNKRKRSTSLPWPRTHKLSISVTQMAVMSKIWTYHHLELLSRYCSLKRNRSALLCTVFLIRSWAAAFLCMFTWKDVNHGAWLFDFFKTSLKTWRCLELWTWDTTAQTLQRTCPNLRFVLEFAALVTQSASVLPFANPGYVLVCWALKTLKELTFGLYKWSSRSRKWKVSSLFYHGRWQWSIRLHMGLGWKLLLSYLECLECLAEPIHSSCQSSIQGKQV